MPVTPDRDAAMIPPVPEAERSGAPDPRFMKRLSDGSGLVVATEGPVDGEEDPAVAVARKLKALRDLSTPGDQ